MYKEKDIVRESIDGLNFLAESYSNGNYKGQTVGPVICILIGQIVIIHDSLFPRNCETDINSDLLKSFTNYHEKKETESGWNKGSVDRMIIATARHALAHAKFSVSEDGLFFDPTIGRLSLPFGEMGKFQNQIIEIYRTHVGESK